MNYLIKRIESQGWVEWVKSVWTKSATHMNLWLVFHSSFHIILNWLKFIYSFTKPMHIVSYNIMIFIWNFARAMSRYDLMLQWNYIGNWESLKQLRLVIQLIWVKWTELIELNNLNELKFPPRIYIVLSHL